MTFCPDNVSCRFHPLLTVVQAFHQNQLFASKFMEKLIITGFYFHKCFQTISYKGRNGHKNRFGTFAGQFFNKFIRKGAEPVFGET